MDQETTVPLSANIGETTASSFITVEGKDVRKHGACKHALEARGGVGQITLKPVELGRVRALTLNADASGGSVRLEILTAAGYRIKGFTKDEEIAVRANRTFAVWCVWNVFRECLCRRSLPFRLTTERLGNTIAVVLVLPLAAAPCEERSMKTISMKLPDRLHAQLEQIASQRAQTKSAIVRSALEEFLSGKSQREKPISALELAGDILGSADGPRDLSTNPKHMEGYGT